MDAIPISAINHFVYCPRRAYLIHADGTFIQNEHTLHGDLIHAHADHPGFEQRAGWKLLRALPVWSDRFGLNGKADLVEVTEARGVITETRPVEYKSGHVSKWANDRAQLCAQALCLEEMLGLEIGEGLIFHAKSQKRSVVVFDAELRTETLRLVFALRAMLKQAEVPQVLLKPQCDGCSLRPVCLPEADSRLASQRKALFSV